MGSIKSDMEKARATAAIANAPVEGFCDCLHALLRHAPPPPGANAGKWGACAAVGCACRGAKRNGDPIAWLTHLSPAEAMDARRVPIPTVVLALRTRRSVDPAFRLCHCTSDAFHGIDNTGQRTKPLTTGDYSEQRRHGEPTFPAPDANPACVACGNVGYIPKESPVPMHNQEVVPSLLAAELETHIAAITLLIITAHPDKKLTLTADALSAGGSLAETDIRNAVVQALKGQQDFPESTTNIERVELHERARGAQAPRKTRAELHAELTKARKRKLNSRRKA